MDFSLQVIKAEPRPLTEGLRDFLWDVALHISRAWQINFCSSIAIASTFRECVHLKCEKVSSYLNESHNGSLIELIRSQKIYSAYPQFRQNHPLSLDFSYHSPGN